MTKLRLLSPGSTMDALVASKLFGGKVRAFSTDPNYAMEVHGELKRRGYDLQFEETEVLECDLVKDSIFHGSVWGWTYEEAVCRAALKITVGDLIAEQELRHHG